MTIFCLSADLKVAFLLFHQPNHLCQALIGVTGLSVLPTAARFLFFLRDKHLNALAANKT